MWVCLSICEIQGYWAAYTDKNFSVCTAVTIPMNWYTLALVPISQGNNGSNPFQDGNWPMPFLLSSSVWTST